MFPVLETPSPADYIAESLDDNVDEAFSGFRDSGCTIRRG